MLYVNPAVARPNPQRRHARPTLKAGERLYVPASELPPMAADGTRDVITAADWRELRASIRGAEQLGTTWNLAATGAAEL